MRDVPNEFRDDPLVVLACVSQRGRDLEQAHPNFQGNFQIASAAVQNDRFAILHVSQSLRLHNNAFGIKVAKIDGMIAMKFLNQSH